MKMLLCFWICAYKYEFIFDYSYERRQRNMNASEMLLTELILVYNKNENQISL